MFIGDGGTLDETRGLTRQMATVPISRSELLDSGEDHIEAV